MDPGGAVPVALVGEARVLKPGTIAIEQVESVGPLVEVAGDAGLAAVGEFDALIGKALLKDFLPPVAPASGTGLVQRGDPGRERVQQAQHRRVSRSLRNQQRADLSGLQEQAPEAHVRWA